MKFRISQDCDYVNGYLRYGHLEGEIEVNSKEELEKMIKENPAEVREYMNLIIDDYEVNDYDEGDNPIEFKEIKEDN